MYMIVQKTKPFYCCSNFVHWQPILIIFGRYTLWAKLWSRLQGSVITQTVLGGLTKYPLVSTFLWCICVTLYEIWLAVERV